MRVEVGQVLTKTVARDHGWQLLAEEGTAALYKSPSRPATYVVCHSGMISTISSRLKVARLAMLAK